MLVNRRVRSVILNILFILVCAGVAYGISNLLFTSIPVDGVSMEATLHDGDRILLYKIGNYQYGDIVVFNSHIRDTDGGEKYLVKRIIGLPGDVIEVKLDGDGKYYTYRNGEKLIENYLGTQMAYDCPPITVEPGAFFYMGDNRGPSSDSRGINHPLGKLDSILGRVILRYNTSDGFDVSVVKRMEVGV
jgi:signal peptidase I, bacterial type